MKSFDVKKVGVTAGIVLLSCVIILGGGKLIAHEKRQNQQIASLNQKVVELNKMVSDQKSHNNYLEARLQQVTDYYNFHPEYQVDSFNYLALGNSLTLIPEFGNGICSTKPDKDYYTLVESYLKQVKGPIIGYRYNFFVWEDSLNRNSALKLLDIMLSDKLNLVTIQLGENVRDTSKFETDLESLIKYVRSKAPKAQIIVVGDFWNKERNNQRKTAAENQHCAFADLREIMNDKNYQSKEGTECLLKNGKIIKVSKNAETHPNDAGMKYIADQIIKNIW